MSTSDTVFAGSIPAMYDRYMAPLLFRPYAEEVARRAQAFAPGHVLETAAGTGIATETLHHSLSDANILATDLNPPMLEIAARRVRSDKVNFETADAQNLRFADSTFDLVVCQFGVMFFPDKVRANAEARRVLRGGGHYLLVIWNSVEHNLATKVAGHAVAGLFPDNSAAFYERMPFRYHDRSLIERDLRSAAFDDIDFETLELVSRAPSARDAALGLTQGTPMRTEIESRGPDALARATDAAEQELRQFEGPDGFAAPMSAHIVTATK